MESCAPDNLGPAVQAGRSGFEAIVPDWSLDPTAQRRLWQRGTVRKELEKQLRLLERIGALAAFDQRTVERLRAELTAPGLAGEVPRRKAPAAPAPRTNQDVFEQYRAIVELDNRSRRDWRPPDANPVTVTMVSFGEWLGRHKRRAASGPRPSETAGRTCRHGRTSSTGRATGRPCGTKKIGARSRVARSRAPYWPANLARAVEWTTTGDLEYPWAAEVDGTRWRVRLNDFPDEILYCLMIDQTAVGDFHDWPDRRTRGQ